MTPAFSRALSVMAMAMLLAACAAPPKFLAVQPKPAEGAGYVLARSPRLDETSHLVGHLDADKNIVYTQNFGGGGVGLGLLLGPLGVAANIGMIDSETKKDIASLYGRVDLKPAETFRRAALARGLPLALTAAPGAGRLTPYVLVTRIENDRVLIAAALLIEHGAPPQQWTGRYLVRCGGCRYVLCATTSQASPSSAPRRTQVSVRVCSTATRRSSASWAARPPKRWRANVRSPSAPNSSRRDSTPSCAAASSPTMASWSGSALSGPVYALRKSNVTYTINAGMTTRLPGPALSCART